MGRGGVQMKKSTLHGREPRFLCDAMLGRLGRWLRAAGYDTLIAPGAEDRALVERAIADGRILLTRDRKLQEIRGAARHAVVVESERLPQLASELTQRFGVDWLLRPFQRCLVCNLVLTPAPELARRRLPADVRATAGEVNYCRQCDRLYWPGGHVRRMTRRLERWRAGEFV